MALEIVHFGTPVLHQKGEPITEFDESLKSLFDDMVETCIEAEGIGLAAHQIGKTLMFCVVDLRGIEIDFDYTLDGGKPPLELFNPIGMCNPIVTKIESPKTIYEEGCLSFPDIRGDVERTDWIRCQYQDIDGNPHELECNGLLGRCVQHEVDHLNGILFTERMKKKVLRKILPEINELRARTAERLGR